MQFWIFRHFWHQALGTALKVRIWLFYLATYKGFSYRWKP